MESSTYLVVSDLHLADIEDHPDGWKAHKSARHKFDSELRELVGWFRESSQRADGMTLVLNGDTFDFDLVTAVPEQELWPMARSERRRGLEPTAARSVWKLRRILQDHRVFLETIAEFLAAGNRVVYVMGNHDREFHFHEVQELLLYELKAAAAREGGGFDPAALRYEPWFFHVPGVLYAEHGNQYDYYSSFRYLLHPVVERGGEPMIALPMGNLSNRYLVNRMGYFNPHASDFILDAFRYAAHWLKYYALTRRSLVLSWFLGSLQIMARLLACHRQTHRPPEGYERLMEEAAQRANLPASTLDALASLHRPPITTRFHRIVRELWIDRLVLLMGMIVGTCALALAPVPMTVKVMLPLAVFPLVVFAYERLAQGETIFTVEHQVPEYARKVTELLAVKVVTFGHTHRPRVIPLAKGSSFVDTGTWAPSMPQARGQQQAAGFRNYLVVTAEGSDVRMELGSWMPAPASIRSAQGAAARVVNALSAIRRRVSHV